MTHPRLLVLVAIAIGLAARAATVTSPLFDFHSWRQADTAAVARNFVEERFNPLYPQVDWRGEQEHGYVETGFEVLAFLVAALAKVVGFSPVLGRLVNVALFPAAALLLFVFVRRRYGETEASLAVIVYSIGLPLTLYIDRAFMNESSLTLLSFACLWAAQSYLESARLSRLGCLILASALIAAIKPTFLIIWGPILGLFLEHHGRRALLRWDLWLAACLTVLTGALWFSHARSIGATTGLTFGVGDKLMDFEILASAEYPFKIALRLFKDILGPVGPLFMLLGAWVALRRERYAEALGLIGFAVYLGVVVTGNFHHNYYQLPLVPAGTVLIAVGIATAVDGLKRRYGWTEHRTMTAYGVIVAVVALSTLVRSVSAHNWYELDRSRMQFCEALRPHLSSRDRIVFVEDFSPDILFCLHRKGWLLGATPPDPDYLRGLAGLGGSVLVVRRDNRESAGASEAMGPTIVETEAFKAIRSASSDPIKNR